MQATCPVTPPAIRVAARALFHVHTRVDCDRQWQHAVSSLRELTDLERATVWTELMKHCDDEGCDISHSFLMHSALKTLYKQALRAAREHEEVTSHTKHDFARLSAEVSDLTSEIRSLKITVDLALDNIPDEKNPPERLAEMLLERMKIGARITDTALAKELASFLVGNSDSIGVVEDRVEGTNGVPNVDDGIPNGAYG